MHHDDRSVFDALDRSVFGRLLSAGFDAWGQASAASRVVAAWRIRGRQIAEARPAARLAAVGVTGLMAAVTAVTLGWSTRPPGVYWLLIPGLAIVFAATALILAAGAAARPAQP